MIELDILEKLRAIKARTGLSESEQIRQGIRWWLESREWPSRTPERDEAAGKPRAEPGRARKRRRRGTTGNEP
jgi:Arc/MetJ-type ribon-helix-helix transcriptional regulator